MTRFLPKRFASTAIDVGQFGSYQAQGATPGCGTITTDDATIQALGAWGGGWSSATNNAFKLPRIEEMNGVCKVLSDAIVNQFTDGITFWQANMPVTAYQTIVQYQTGTALPTLYVNITGENGTTTPDQDNVNWSTFIDVVNGIANRDLSNLTATGEAHFANPSLSNLNAAGEARFAGKANIDLDNLSQTGINYLKSLIGSAVISGDTGYLILGDLKIQFGYAPYASYYSQYISFPTPFSTKVMTIVTAGQGTYIGSGTVISWSLTGFTARTGADSHTSTFWLAVGL